MGWFFHGKCRSKARLDNKVVVITGCNTGIGKYTAYDLYSRGAKVIMACRDMVKAESASDWVKQQCAGKTGVGQLSICHLDLASLTSVRKCAQKIHDEEKLIHLLINNAGIMSCPRSLTEDGYELQFATNHLGHFLFTLILLPRILSAAPARIVNVASLGHIMCNSMSFDDINLEKSYIALAAYGRSKAANILFTKELARRLKDMKVTVYAVHPGCVDTDLFRHFDSTIFPGASWISKNIGGPLFLRTPKQGAQTTLYCALEEKTANETGLYYSDCQVSRSSALTRKASLAKQLWDVSLEMVNFSPLPPFGKSTAD